MLLRPLSHDDVRVVAAIQAQDAVAAHWGAPDEAELAAKAAGTDESTAFAIELDGEVVGLIQYHEEDDPMYRHAGMDIFLTASHHGEGFGTEALKVLARHLFEERGHHRLTIDPAADNAAAIRAYEKVGFQPVGVMRRYERDVGGHGWHDGLLMELVVD